MGVETALLVGLAAASTAATVESSNQQRRIAGQAKNEAMHDQKTQERALADQKAQEQRQQDMFANRDRSRAARSDYRKDTRGGTLLTSSLTPAAKPVGASKTLLGT